MRLFEAGETDVTAEEMIKSFVEDTSACKLKPNRRWATRWRHEWLYSCKKVNQSGVYYEYNDPVMVKARWSFHNEYMLTSIQTCKHTYVHRYDPRVTR